VYILNISPTSSQSKTQHGQTDGLVHTDYQTAGLVRKDYWTSPR